VRVRDICVEAKLTERYFYESFENLEQLFVAVYEAAVAHIRTAILGAVQIMGAVEPRSRTVHDLAEATLRAYLETLRNEPRLARILLVDVLTVGSDVANQSRLAVQSFAELIKDLLIELYPDFPKQDLDPNLIANGLVGSTVYLTMHWVFGGFREPLDQILKHCQIFYESIELRSEVSKPGSRRRQSA
jgi:AcrR family transcriptional regulator